MKANRLVIAVAQMKFRAAIPDNVAWITQTIHAAAKAGADAILFPECAVTGYHCDFAAVSPTEVQTALGSIASAARAARCHVLVGSPTFSKRKRFNSLVVFNRRGQEIFEHLGNSDGYGWSHWFWLAGISDEYARKHRIGH
ncbi:MAG: hypothetical protein NTW03_07985 [Verrucomicrobia bacterium]|nr:hypothetical protein [Verrucomicrobiota bacterium]